MDFAVNFPIKTTKGFTRTDFYEVFRAKVEHGLGAVDPEDGAGRLFDKGCLDIGCSRFNLPLTLATTGILASEMVISSRTSARRFAAGSMSVLWKGALT